MSVRWNDGAEKMVQVFPIHSRRVLLIGMTLAAWLAVAAACGSGGGTQDGPSIDDHAVDVASPSSDSPRHGNGSRGRDPVVPAKPSEVQGLTGARTRVVWTQDVAKGTDYGGRGEKLIMMGYDSQDGLGERPLLPKPDNYAKPLISPLGDRVVFSDNQRSTAFVVNWDGSGLRKLGKGIALATWMDPKKKREYVYVGTDLETDPGTFGRVTRHPIDRWDASEVVWDQRRVSPDNFQVSADGRRAGGLFPWPAAGVIELPNGRWRRLGRGCWTSLAGGDLPLFWIFHGDHRNLTIVDFDRDERWKVNINNAPGIDGYEVYHPRWANHPRFLTVTGPYTVGKGENKIRAGGPQVEIYLGRFAADYTAVESWVQVTDNRRADFSPDAWIDPSGGTPARPTGDVKRGPPASSAEPDLQPEKRWVVEARVVVAAPIPTPSSILPYHRALLVNEYEIVRVLEGTLEEKRILVAHWVIRDGQVLPTAAREPGSVHRMTLGPYDDHLELEGERLVMDSDEFHLSLYYDINS